MNSASLPYANNARPPLPPQPSAAAGAAFPQEPQLPVYTVAASKMGTPETDIASPTAAPTSWTPSTNPRSCTTCRKRKVGCDKRQPCSNCTKASIECRFPPPGRAPRRSKKPPDTELLARLRRLEGVVQSLGKGANGEDLPIDAQLKIEEGKDTVSGDGRKGSVNRQDDKYPSTKPRSTRSLPDTGVELELGRLVVDEGTSRSRYVSNGFWAALSEQVAEMRDILDDPSDDEGDYPSPGSERSSSAEHQGFIFSFNSNMGTLRTLHPAPSQISTFWSIFKENVDPVVKMFHVPSKERVFEQASLNLDHVNRSTEALLFAIYLAVVTSLSNEQCKTLLLEEKDAALKKYRFAAEQALARSGFLNTQDIIVLQALTLFLISVRRYDDTRFVWAMTGLLIRLAQSLGLHRDGEQYGLTPFETEMRRRLWWQVLLLDFRAAEDQGADPALVDHVFDTKLPLNINDADILPEAKFAPEERSGGTEQTFCLIRYEVSSTLRCINYSPQGQIASIEDKERLIEGLRHHLEEKYLKHIDDKVPLYWITGMVARLILGKMWLVLHHPLKRADRGAGLPQDTREQLFLTAIEVIDVSHELETTSRTSKWGWLFRSYVQWYAVVYVLSELCVRTKGPLVDRAWATIEGVFDQWGGRIASNRKGMLWRPMRKLMTKARAARARELQKAVMFPLDGSLGPSLSAESLGIPRVSETQDLRNTVRFDQFAAFPDTSSVGTMPVGSSLQPNFPIDEPQFTSEDINRWMAEDPTFAQDFGSPEDMMNWTNWDDMVQDLDYNPGAAPPRAPDKGPVVGGGTWW